MIREIRDPRSPVTGRRSAPARRFDPGRRDRIIDVCLDVIAEVGVVGTTHRRVADAADVPLGSMTYHFTGMTELLHAALSRHAQTAGDRFDERLAAASDTSTATMILIDIIVGDNSGQQQSLVLTQELYTLAMREPRYRDITYAWMARARRTLERYFDPPTARMLAALIEGLTIHRALEGEPHDTAMVAVAVERITTTSP